MLDSGWDLLAIAPCLVSIAIGVRYRRSTTAFLAAGAVGSIGFAVALGYASGASPQLLVFYAVMGTVVWSGWAAYVVIARKWLARQRRQQ